MRHGDAVGLSYNLSDGTDPADGANGASGDPTVEQAPSDDPFAVLGGIGALLQLSEQCLVDSTHYLDSNVRRQIETNLANFQSRHPAGSKYHSPTYKHRSRLFVPRTRSVALRTEAAGAAAFFSTREATFVEPRSQDDPAQVAGAALHHKLLEHRLKHSIKWFQTAIGAIQDCFVQGVCISRQGWDYRVDSDGEVIADQPTVTLIPIEHLRWQASADWCDPLADSEYLIEIMPMTVARVMERMRPVGEEPPEWRPASWSAIATAARTPDSLQSARESNRGAPDDNETVPLHRIVYVYRLIVRREGIDYTWYSLGTDHLLTAPARLKDINPQGRRLYRMGAMNIESHRAVPQSTAEHLMGLQADVNHTRNDRKDNVALALNKRYLVSRNGRVDMPALMRNVPGGSISVNDVNSSVKEIQTNDVTASSWREEESTNAAFDEMAGSFSQSSVNTNRRMSETAAGMELIAADANVITEYHLEVFATTWYEPVLQDLLALQQAFESDETVIALAAEQMELAAEYGLGMPTEEIMSAPVTLSVSVGVDATNPTRRFERLQALGQSGAALGLEPNGPELYREMAGSLGFDNGDRFIIQPDPNAQPAPDPVAEQAAMQQEAEDMKAQVMQAKMEQDGQIAMQRMQLDAERLQADATRAQQQYEIAMAKMQIDAESRIQQGEQNAMDEQAALQSREEIALMQDSTTREIAGLNAESARQQKLLDGEIMLQREAMKPQPQPVQSGGDSNGGYLS